MKKIILVILVAALGSLPAVAQANLITNGSFENPAIGFGSFQFFSTIPGWATNFGCCIEIQNHAAGSPFDGNQLVEMDSNQNSGMISTSLATTPGQSYVLS